MNFWGITGTNGKTTTTWIFAEFLNAAGRKCGYITTVEVFDGKDRYYTGYTTPPLAQLKEIYAKMEANGCTDCVMEVSSHAIHQHRTGDTVFSGGAFTNLSEDHLDYHKTMEAYFDVKLDFARQIAAWNSRSTEKADSISNAILTPKQVKVEPKTIRATERVSAEGAERAESRAPYIVCLDGENGEKMFEAVSKLALKAIGVSNRTCRTVGTSRTSGAYDLSQLQLAGDYNQSNVLTAAALAEAAGVSHEIIQSVIPTLKPRWGRLELVENPNVKAKVYVDFAHTPDGLEKVLKAVRKLLRPSPSPSSSPSPLLWVVFGAGGDRDPMKRPLMGAACAKFADRLVVTSDNPRSEDPNAIIAAIVAGINRVIDESNNQTIKQSNNLTVEPDRAKAIRYALTNAREGDIVVIAGKGHETTQEINGIKHPFDDREQVRNFKP